VAGWKFQGFLQTIGMLHARGVCRLARFLDLDAQRRGEMRVHHGARVAHASGLKAKDFRLSRRHNVPAYDTILLAPAEAIVAHLLASRVKQAQAELQVWPILLRLGPWLTQPCANYLRLQILKVAPPGFGYLGLTLTHGNSASR
jgi:hypothetical protein